MFMLLLRGFFYLCKMQNLTNTEILASLKTDVSIAKERRKGIMGTIKRALIHHSFLHHAFKNYLQSMEAANSTEPARNAKHGQPNIK